MCSCTVKIGSMITMFNMEHSKRRKKVTECIQYESDEVKFVAQRTVDTVFVAEPGKKTKRADRHSGW